MKMPMLILDGCRDICLYRRNAGPVHLVKVYVYTVDPESGDLISETRRGDSERNQGPEDHVAACSRKAIKIESFH
jgi:hypothetical protein